MENNNGRGIFYGVIGVATLIVAIIGATFAYFTATASSNVDAVTAAGATVTLSWNEDNKGLHSGLIPVAANTDKFNKKVTNTADGCKDDKGNRICSVYTFTIGNPSETTAQQIYASLRPSKNEFTTTNLKFAVFSGTAADVASSIQTVDTTPSKTPATAQPGDLMIKAKSISGSSVIDLTELNELLPASQDRTYTVVLWIDEAGEEQNADQGKLFNGGIFFTTQNGESANGITGILAA